MTTYNTGNPIGSTDARDRSDNSENLDLAVNSLSQTFVDRLGVTRDTLEGIYQKSAYYRVGTFNAGYTLTNNRQTLAHGNVEYSWSGAFPKVVAAGSTPETSGGVGAGAWVDRTDTSLRSEINLVTKTYPTLNQMVADTTLKIGDVVRYLGYINIFDEGGNTGVIVASEDAGDHDYGSVILLDNGNKAVFEFKESINVAKFGVFGNLDGETNRIRAQAAIDYAVSKNIGVIDFNTDTYTISPKTMYSLWVYNADTLELRGNGAEIIFNGRCINVLDSKNIKLRGFKMTPDVNGNAGVVVHCSSNGIALDRDLEQWTDGVYGVDDYRTENVDISDFVVTSGTALACIYIGFSHDGKKDTGHTAGLIKNIRVNGSYCAGSANHGVSVSFTTNVKIYECTFDENTAYAVDLSNGTTNGSVDRCVGLNTNYFCKIQSAYSRDGTSTVPTGVVHNKGCSITNNFVSQKTINSGETDTWLIMDTGIDSNISNNYLDSCSIYAIYLRGRNGVVHANHIVANHNSTWTGRNYAMYLAAWDAVGTAVAVRLSKNNYEISSTIITSNKTTGTYAILGGYQLYSSDSIKIVNTYFYGYVSEFIYINSGGEGNGFSNVVINGVSGNSHLAMNFILLSYTAAVVNTLRNWTISNCILTGLNTFIQSSTYIYYNSFNICNNVIAMGAGGIRFIVNFYDGGRIDKFIMSNNKISFTSTTSATILQGSIVTHNVITNNIIESPASSSKNIVSLTGTSTASDQNLGSCNITQGFYFTSLVGTIANNQVSTYA